MINAEAVILKEKPRFCRGKVDSTPKKPPCVDCTVVCLYKIQDILDISNGIGQNDILAELVRHRHPSSRIMPNGTQRVTKDAARELADHYIYSHNKKDPVN
jgi:hypothetical protein